MKKSTTERCTFYFKIKNSKSNTISNWMHKHIKYSTGSKLDRLVKRNQWYDRPCILHVNIYAEHREIFHQCNR